MYSAYDPVLDRKVALKFVRDQAGGSSGSTGAQTRLLREAQALAKLSHPNIVTVFDVGTYGDEVFLAMEFLVGQTLKDWLTQTERSWQEIVDVMLDAGRGLAAAHNQGLVHRDVKPSNILVTDDGRVLVMDFGLVQAQTSGDGVPSWSAVITGVSTALDSQLTAQGEVMGTPSYMSPEQHRGEGIGPTSDQFGFCVTFYEALYGVRPFGAPALADLRHAVDTGTLQSPARSHGPRKLLDVVRRGLEVDPARRYPSMDGLLAVVRGFRRRRSRAWTLAVGVGMAGAVGAGVTWAGLAQPEVEPCTGANLQLAAVWNDGLRDQVAAAFLGTQKSYAEVALGRVRSRLDGYAREWAEMHRDACEATTLRGEQSAEILDLRMGCLYGAKVSLAATAKVLAAADVGVVQKAHAVLSGLRPLERCDDVEALRSAVDPPTPAEKATVETIQAALAEAAAEYKAGHYDRAIRPLEQAEALAETSSYLPVRTEIALQRAYLHEQRGEFEAAEAGFQTAFARATRWEQWSDLFDAVTALIETVAHHQADPERALMLRPLAEGLADKDGSPEARSKLHSTVASVFLRQRRYSEAEAEYRRATELLEKSVDADDAQLATRWNNLAAALGYQGKLAQAEREFRRALELNVRVLGPDHPFVSTNRLGLGLTLVNLGEVEAGIAETRQAIAALERSLGSNHPMVGIGRHNLAVGLMGQERFAPAEEEERRALEVFENALGPEHPNTANACGGLADAIFRQNRPADALVYAERSWAIRGKDGSPAEQAIAAFRLARILAATNQTPERAKTLAELAAARYRALGSEMNEYLAAVEEWLAEHH